MTSTITNSYYVESPVDTRWSWLVGDEAQLKLNIENRIQNLEDEARDYRIWSVTSMLTAGVGVLGGVALFSIPVLGFAVGAMPLAGLIWSVVGDGAYTGKSTLSELSASTGHWDDPEAEFNKLANFMEEHEAVEYKFLVKYQDPLIGHLLNHDGFTSRFVEYQQKLREYRLHGLLEFQDRPQISPERMQMIWNLVYGDPEPTVIQTEPTLIQQTRLPQAPPKVSRSHAVEVIGSLPPARTQSQQAPTVLQEDLYYQPNSKPIAIPVYEEFPTEIQQHDLLPQLRDVAKEIANYDGHVALVSKTRSGKTTLLIGVVLEAVAAGHQVILVDGKGDKRLKALGELQNCQYIHCNTSDKVANLNAVLDRLLNVLVQRQDGEAASNHPITFIADELNMIRDAVADEGVNPADGKNLLFTFDKKTKKVVLQGAAAKIYFRGANHTSRVEDWGWNTGVLDSLSFLALGRNGAYESIEDLLRWQISNGKPFQQLLEDYRKQSFDEPLALTTLHPIGFCRIPHIDYESHKLAKPKEQWLGNVRKAEDLQEDLSDLTEDELAVYHYAKSKGQWMSARLVSHGKLKPLIEGENNKTPYIRKIFTSLYEKDLGEIKGAEGSMEFRAI